MRRRYKSRGPPAAEDNGDETGPNPRRSDVDTSRAPSPIVVSVPQQRVPLGGTSDAEGGRVRPVTENPRLGALSRAAKARARAYVNANFPESATRLRDLSRTVGRHLAVEDRLGALERTVYSGVSSDDSIHGWECSIHSQNGEDGILLNLFSRIGATSRTFLEFGCGTGIECNSANLALGFGWGGLLVDANENHVTKARIFIGSHLGANASRVGVRRQLVTPENINDLLAEVSPPGQELDLLSIDVDSIDYWIWDAVRGFQPRVVVVEYNASLGPTRSVSVASHLGFDPFSYHPSGFYHGASLEALRKLGTSRGYQLIGCDSSGVNAFFVRRDCGSGLPDLDALAAYVPNAWRRHPAPPDQQFDLIRHLPFTNV